MKRHRVLQGMLALFLTVSLLAPSAAALACGSGDACCAMMSMEHRAHGSGDRLTAPSAPTGCPMMAACALTSPATIPQTATSAPASRGTQLAAAPSESFYPSFVGIPLAPPPKA
jgi:hypothetical protein